MDASADGKWDEASGKEVCVAKTGTCPCGTNQNKCSEYDAYEKKNMTWCQTTKMDGFDNPCPVTCKSSEQSCFVVNFDKTGEPTSFKEECSPIGKDCRCGTNAVACGPKGATECWPSLGKADKKLVCPVECTATQKLCSIPVYAEKGKGNWEWTKDNEYCAADKTTACDCTKFG